MVNYQNWIGEKDDDTEISRLSLPGTHNSAACHIALPSVKCQDHSVSTQLQNGIRFFDFRLGKLFLKDGEDGKYNGKELQVIHGKFPVRIPIPLKFSSVLDELYSFLDQNPNETCVVSIKQEGENFDDKSEFPRFVWDRYINQNLDKWYLNGDIPKLRDARGKVILFRRFGLTDEFQDRPFGIDAAWWPYNTINDDRGVFQVQDFCEVKHAEDIKTKAGYVKDFLQTATQHNSSTDAAPRLFVNFCTGANLFDRDCWPEKVADEMRRCNIGELVNKGCGIVILDYAGRDNWDLVKSIVDSNF
ncbi:LAQU0S02e05160g1_1 [Lachancea quebecensis]|uniref:LAQU0S02e05160g1_1 n=1 Tax=Lachancea quebecensis TaxID=1654605 RepID=A0A0P1KY26_9SACH|nr:LAQU0S02e05160g1_1 [Lachancea quebecensis]